MREQPHALELLRTARETLKSLLAELPREHHYPLLMTMNAMAIAGRDIATAATVEEELLVGFHALYGSEAALQANESLAAGLARLNRRLVADIRAGHLDDQAIAVEALLLAQTRAALSISNPKALAP